MFLTVDANITIRAAPEAIWAYAYKPENWTASNPTEHFGLHFDSPDNVPHAGVTFTQRKASPAYERFFAGAFITWIVLALRFGRGLRPIAWAACSLFGSLKAVFLAWSRARTVFSWRITCISTFQIPCGADSVFGVSRDT